VGVSSRIGLCLTSQILRSLAHSKPTSVTLGLPSHAGYPRTLPGGTSDNSPAFPARISCDRIQLFHLFLHHLVYFS
jgi:hypothetical protein